MNSSGPAGRSVRDFAAYGLLFAALMALFAPTIWDLHSGLWTYAQHSHGPIVLLIWVWLLIKGWADALKRGAALCPAPVIGGGVLAVGLATYVLGRSQGFALLEVASLPLVILGGVLVLFGGAVARRMWFPFVFAIFLLPLPATLIDAVTQPLKLAVSQVSEQVLYLAGYPIARSGVTLMLGRYELLVADACSGLNSLFMLEAFGLFYLNVVRYQSPLRNIFLALLILPISFASNVMRVLTLALITYYWGDEAGRGFVHTFAGVLLFVCAMLLVLTADALLRAAFPWRTAPARLVA
ncbi:MAG: exosortase B [Rhizobacter sp.]